MKSSSKNLVPPRSTGGLAVMLLILLSMNGSHAAAAAGDCATATGTSCSDCLAVDSNCAWAEGLCLNSCSEIADVDCYSLETFPGQTPEAICQIEETTLADWEHCHSQSSCGDCSTAMLSDGISTCSWYDLGRFGGSFCSNDPNLWWTESGPVDECTPVSPCEAASTCIDCLAMADKCSWNGGECFPECFIADTPCYNTNNFPDHSPEAICLIEENALADQALCADQYGCDGCTGTILSDGISTCSWYDLGHGDRFCDSDPGLWWTGTPPVPQCPPVSPCEGASTCTECLTMADGCSWNLGECHPECFYQDTPCYSVELFPDHTPEAICLIEENALADQALCAAQSGCGDCTGTILSDGISTCSWYDMGSWQFCDSDPSLWGTESEPVDECSTVSPCEGATTCTDCLTMADGCAWNGGECYPACFIADTPCYSAELFPDHTPEAICLIEEITLADQALCADQYSCGECTSTIQSDGSTPCYWYQGLEGDGSTPFCASEPHLWYMPSPGVSECILD